MKKIEIVGRDARGVQYVNLRSLQSLAEHLDRRLMRGDLLGLEAALAAFALDRAEKVLRPVYAAARR